MKDWVRGGGLLLVLGLVLVVEMTSGEVRRFYSERPIQAGILTSLLLAAAAFFGFDAIRAQVEERRRTPLSRLAYTALAFQTTLLIDVALWLVTEKKPVNDSAPSLEAAEKLGAVRAGVGLGRPSDDDLGAIVHDDYGRQLDQLCANAEWCGIAVHELDRAKWRNRDALASWTSAMLTTGHTADVLNRLAKLNEGLDSVQAPLRELAQGDRTVSSQMQASWVRWLAEAISLREDLFRLGRGLPDEWRKFRTVLPPEMVDELEARHEVAATDPRARRVLTDPLFDLSP